MARVIIILVSTFSGLLFGLLVGYLTLQAQFETATIGAPVTGEDLVVSYLVAPALGAVFGFVLAVAAIMRFGPPKQ